MKKIYINENSISNVLTKRLLPQFLFKMVRNHTTSLGDNEAFPTSDDYPFDYTLLKERYNEVCEEIEGIGMASLDEDSLVSELSSLVKECKELEKPVRDSLEKLCENALNKLFAIPEEAINFKFKLVDKIKFKNSIRMKPESNNETQYTFKDVAEIDLSSKAIKKRRFIDALIQGASYTYSRVEGLYLDEIDKINPELPRMYRKIRIINDYLLFTKKEEMSDDKPMQGSYVETHLGIGNNRTTISVQGIIFPLLLQESIRGMFELFSSHGLPQDRKKAEYIVKKADFVLAEPWDLRLGVGLWKMIFGSVEDTNMIPYMFTAFVKMPTDEFNLSAREILSSTEKGQSIIDELIKNAEYDNGYQQFTNRINAKNLDKALIQDSYFTGAETNGYEIDTENEEGDVIEEEGEDPNNIESILSTATVDNIDFIEGESDGYGEKVYLSVNGVEIPLELVNLDFRVVNKRFPTGRQQLLNIDIILDPKLRGFGLGTKIYAKAVREFGAICSRFSTRHNDAGIRGIFTKLNSFGDIYTFEDSYQNLEGETINDYYAILKSELNKYIPMQESKQAKRSSNLLTEGWGKDKRRIVSRTLNVLKDNLPWNNILELKDIERKIVIDYFHGRKASSPKFRIYEPMIAKILTGEFGYPNNPTNKKEIKNLQKIFKYIWLLVENNENVDIFCKYNDSLGRIECDDFETLMSKYYDKAKAYDEQLKNEVNAKLENSPYTINEVKTFEEANEKFSKWSYHGLPLCFTTSRAQWANFTKGGENTAYVCLKDGWKDVPEEEGENFPYDDYGLSMIWVFVDDEGNLTNCCIRWNHHGEGKMINYPYGGTGADDALTESSISNIIGVPFESAFVSSDVSDFKERVDRVVAKLAAGESGIDHFPNARQLNNHLFLINIKGRYNFYNMITNEIVNPDVWFDAYSGLGELRGVGRYKGIFGEINIGRKLNFVNEFGEIVSPNLWFDNIDDFFGHFVVVAVSNKLNIIDMDSENPQFLLPKWAVKIVEYESRETGEVNYFVLYDNGSLYIAFANDFENLHNAVDILNGVVNDNKEANELFVNLDGNIDRTGIVKIGKFYNVIDFNTKTLKSPSFFTSIDNIGTNYYECTYRKFEYGEYGMNILKQDGTFLLDLPFDSLPNRISTDDNTIFKCFFKYQHETRINFTKEDGKLVFDNPISEWPTNISEFDVGVGENYTVYAIKSNGKWNILNYDLQLVWKKPVNEWFDRVDSSYMRGFMEVEMNGKENFINYKTGELLVNKEPQDWYYSVLPFNDRAGELVIKVIGAEDKNNIIFSDGSMLFNEGEGCKHITEFGKDTLFLTMSYNEGPFRLYDIPTRSYITEWFEKAEIQGSNIRFVQNGIEYYYDTLSKTLTNISESRQKRLEALTPENIDSEQNISVFIPNKMYRIRMPYLDETRSNVIINNNGRYEYLFDEWFLGIHKPIGNAMCLIKKYIRGGVRYGDVYDISKNQVVFENIEFCDIDHENNLISVIINKDEFSLDTRNDYNIITPQCELLFNENLYGFNFDGPYIKTIKLFDSTKKYNLFNPSNREYILNDYVDYIEYVEHNNLYIVGVNNPNDRLGYGGRHCSYNVVKDGKLLLDQWYSLIAQSNDTNYYGVVTYKGRGPECNYFDGNTGEFVSDEPIVYRNGVSKVVKNGKYNFLDQDFNPLLRDWADNASNVDNRGYVTVTYGNDKYIYKVENGGLAPLEEEGNTTIPSDFTECNSNQINLIDHRLIYTTIGNRQGQSEHTTTYRQKVTVITSDGRRAEQMYTQRGDESCKWTMYYVYEGLCNQLGIEPAGME